MSGKPIATIGSGHVCPMCSGVVPHIGGPITGPGAPNVLINGKPVALLGDICTCAGGPDVIAQGSSFVKVNDVPVATVGHLTAHGGSIISGEANVTITAATPVHTVTLAREKIPFPIINPISRIQAAIVGHSLTEAAEQQQLLSELATETPVPKNSTTVTLQTTLAQELLFELASKRSFEYFFAFMTGVFGHDIPTQAYEKLYTDAQNKASTLIPTVLVKETIPFGGKALFYSVKKEKVHEIWVAEKAVRQATQTNDANGELLTMLIEEYGHWLDYLLRNKYANTKQKDALRDEGAYFSYKMIQLNSIDQATQDYATATVDGVAYDLVWNYEPFYKGLVQYVNEVRWYQNDCFSSFEFYKAGFLESKKGNYAHGNIERDALTESLFNSTLIKFYGFTKEVDINHYLLNIYFGNWKRDYSQGLDPLIIRFLSNTLNAVAIGLMAKNEDATKVVNRYNPKALKTQTIPEDTTATINFKELGVPFLSEGSVTFKPVVVSVKIICTLLEMLAAKEFVHTPLEEQGQEHNLNYSQYLDELAKNFSPIDRENLGVYVPAEHMDNPSGLGVPVTVTYADGTEKEEPNKDTVLLKEFLGKELGNPSLHTITREFGMKSYIRKASQASTERPSNNRYLNSYDYIIHKLQDASKEGGYNNQACKDSLGAALHTLEDFFAHSNYAEIALIKEGFYGVFPWVTSLGGNVDYLTYLRDPKVKGRLLSSNRTTVVDNAVAMNHKNQLTTRIPLVTGTFGMMDTMASVLPILSHVFDPKARQVKTAKAKKKEQEAAEKNGSFYYKDNINKRSFNDVLFLELLRDITNTDEDIKAKTDSEVVKAYLQVLAMRDAGYKTLQETSDTGHEIFEELPEFMQKAVKWASGGVVGAKRAISDSIEDVVDVITQPIYKLIYNLLGFIADNINDVQVIQASNIAKLKKQLENGEELTLDIGLNPTHTQVAKDDPHHFMHGLSAALAIEAVEKVGTAVFNCWQGKGTIQTVITIVDGIIRHPAQTTWQTSIVKEWAATNKKHICEASSPTAVIHRLAHINDEIKETVATLRKIADEPIFKKLETDIAKQYNDIKTSDAETEEKFTAFEDKLNTIEEALKQQQEDFEYIEEKWEEQFPKPIYCCDTCAPRYEYKVQQGDTLHKIAKRANTTVNRLLEMNDFINPETNTIYTGSTIAVPNPVVNLTNITFEN